MIPKIFHRVWIGENPIPEEYETYWKKWKLLHPDWEFKSWGNEEVKALKSYSIIAHIKNDACKADIARYEIICDYGGIYLDCDMDCYQAIDSLIDKSDEFVVCNQTSDDSCICSNSFFASIPNHPILVNAIKEIEATDISSLNSNDNIAEMTGPYFFTRVINNRKVKRLPYYNFYPYFHLKSEWYKQNLEEVYGIHRWGGSWLPIKSFIQLAKKQLVFGDLASCLDTCQKAKNSLNSNQEVCRSLTLRSIVTIARLRIGINKILFFFLGNTVIALAFYLHSKVMSLKHFSFGERVTRKLTRTYIKSLKIFLKFFLIDSSTVQYKNLLDSVFLDRNLEQQISTLEVGAMDGKSFDKLYSYLRYTDNNRALFVEPLPKMQEALQRNYLASRNEANQYYFEESAVFDEEKDLTIYSIPEEVIKNLNLPDWALGISSLTPEKNALSHTLKSCFNNDITLFEVASPIVVKGKTLRQIVEKYNFDHIDVLQIDTEGYDYYVLSQALNLFKPQIICFEWAHLEDHEKSASIKMLSKEKYISFASTNSYDCIACNQSIWRKLLLKVFSHHSLALLPPIQ